MLELADFTLQKAVMEVRYDPAYLIWDRSGLLASRLKKSFPDFRSKEVRPNQQNYRLAKQLTAVIELEKAHLIAFFPPNNLDDFRGSADKFFGPLLDTLELSVLTRIGFRVFFERPFKGKDEAGKFIVDRLPFLGRSGKHFNIEATSVKPDFIVRWEGEALGCLVSLRSLEAKLEVDVPEEWGTGVEPISSEKNFVQLDVDYYAHGSTSVAKFNASAAIENWMKLIRRDVGGFLNG